MLMKETALRNGEICGVVLPGITKRKSGVKILHPARKVSFQSSGPLTPEYSQTNKSCRK
jgi:hypothetical protein